jgi:hypothetical protein
VRGALPILALAATAGVAHADRPASTGFYAEAGVGATGHLGTARSWSAIGPTVDLRLGLPKVGTSQPMVPSTPSHFGKV